MIINRLLNAIKKQNWFKVFLELIIIVLGVFIGLMIHDRTVHRAGVSEQNQTLTQFEQTINADIDQLRQMKQTVVNKISSLEQLENMVVSGNKNRTFSYISADGGQVVGDFYQGLENSVQYGWQFPLPRSSYVIKSGLVGPSSTTMSAPIREDIQNYFARNSAINAEVNARIPGYAAQVYQMIGQGERTIFVDGQKKEITDFVMPTLNSELAIGAFISKANNENFL
ncbi:MAG TPA: hypothetical protein P5227_13780, partial [Emcibacteraceae bacterium]|nr:hypothetical protein [Emcibacteraceae bacterium]